MKAFAGRGIVCGAVLDTAEVLADPHLRERETIFDLEHPTRGRFSVIGCPVRLSDSPVAAKRAPLKGEHTEDVLANPRRLHAGGDPAAARQARSSESHERRRSPQRLAATSRKGGRWRSSAQPGLVAICSLRRSPFLDMADREARRGAAC